MEGTAAPGQFPSSQGSFGADSREYPGGTESLTWGKLDCSASRPWNCGTARGM